MPNPNLMDQAVRKKIIDEINSHENVARKMKEQRKFDIYRKRQAQYVLERLTDEFDPNTVRDMRKVLSINPCKRIVDEQASLYVNEPDRQFEGASDAEKEQIKDVYKYGKVDPMMRLANRYYKLHGQSCLYARPMSGYVCARALTPKDYDVIPDEDDPEKAFAYILNVLDVELYRSAPKESAIGHTSDQSYNPGPDGENQTIGDLDDRKAKARYVFWTAELHFTCDGNGAIVSTPGDSGDAAIDVKNPIEMLPFVDIAHEKDFNFFVELGSDVAEFVIDFLTQLSDLANTCRFQNYSQAVIYSTEEPKPIKVGPNRVIWLKMDANNATSRPEFTFQSPTPDIMGSLEFLNVQLKMFLSSVGLNPGTVSGKNELEKFTSGIDHLLANLDKFKASKEDMDLFRQAECDLFKIMAAWQNVLFDVTDENGLDEDLKAVKINPDLDLNIVYAEPHAVQTDSEVEDYCIKAIDKRLMTRQEAVKRMYKVDDARAEEIIAEIDKEAEANLARNQDLMAKGFGPDGKPLPKPFGQEGKPGEPPPKPGDKPAPKDEPPPKDKPK